MPCILRSLLGLALAYAEGPSLEFVTEGAVALGFCDRTGCGALHSTQFAGSSWAAEGPFLQFVIDVVPCIPRSLLGLALPVRRRALSTVCHRRRRRTGVM